ncbi:hypothetical protein UPYG_G00316590 [Umbra pygmaea]|uniref:Uncharacterized protein n=1 Tax=Umbra pygmaea TaxID=75934 RepID=A0ABD0VZX5_UMBPY
MTKQHRGQQQCRTSSAEHRRRPDRRKAHRDQAAKDAGGNQAAGVPKKGTGQGPGSGTGKGPGRGLMWQRVLGPAHGEQEQLLCFDLNHQGNHHIQATVPMVGMVTEVMGRESVVAGHGPSSSGVGVYGRGHGGRHRHQHGHWHNGCHKKGKQSHGHSSSSCSSDTD